MADDRDQERHPGEEPTERWAAGDPQAPIPPGAGGPHGPGWTPADTELEEMIAEEERVVQANRKLIIIALGLIALLIAALVLSLLAMNRDIEAVAKAEPKDDSVSTKSIQAGAVTGDKIAPGAVGTDQLADGAVTDAKLADAAVTAAKLAEGSVGGPAIAAGGVGNAALAAESVGRGKIRPEAIDASRVAENSLTGDVINESTLGKVPEAAQADTAADAARLGGLAASAFLSSVEQVATQSDQNLQPIKGPLGASCPSGTVVVGGGARIEGAGEGVALSTNAPDGTTGWIASAEAIGDPGGPWRLVVTAICASTG